MLLPNDSLKESQENSYSKRAKATEARHQKSEVRKEEFEGLLSDF